MTVNLNSFLSCKLSAINKKLWSETSTSVKYKKFRLNRVKVTDNYSKWITFSLTYLCNNIYICCVMFSGGWSTSAVIQYYYSISQCSISSISLPCNWQVTCVWILINQITKESFLNSLTGRMSGTVLLEVNSAPVLMTSLTRRYRVSDYLRLTGHDQWLMIDDLSSGASRYLRGWFLICTLSLFSMLSSSQHLLPLS